MTLAFSKRPLRAILCLSALGLVAACVPQTAPVDPLPPSADACGAGPLQYLVGQKGPVLAPMELPAGTRVIPPGTAVTMDYNPSRLNIDLNEADRITRVYCG